MHLWVAAARRSGIYRHARWRTVLESFCVSSFCFIVRTRAHAHARERFLAGRYLRHLRRCSSVVRVFRRRFAGGISQLRHSSGAVAWREMVDRVKRLWGAICCVDVNDAAGTTRTRWAQNLCNEIAALAKYVIEFSCDARESDRYV